MFPILKNFESSLFRSFILTVGTLLVLLLVLVLGDLQALEKVEEGLGLLLPSNLALARLLLDQLDGDVLALLPLDLGRLMRGTARLGPRQISTRFGLNRLTRATAGT